MRLPLLRSLRYYRERALLSQAKLAARSGVSKSTIMRAEAGDINVFPPTGQKLADALGVTLEQLVERPERNHPEPADWRPLATRVA